MRASQIFNPELKDRKPALRQDLRFDAQRACSFRDSTHCRGWTMTQDDQQSLPLSLWPGDRRTFSSRTLQTLSAGIDRPRVRLSRVLKKLGQMPKDGARDSSDVSGVGALARLDAAHEFEDCPPFGVFFPDPLSVFMTCAL